MLTVTRGLSDAVVAKVAQTVYAVLHMCSTLFYSVFFLTFHWPLLPELK